MADLAAHPGQEGHETLAVELLGGRGFLLGLAVEAGLEPLGVDRYSFAMVFIGRNRRSGRSGN